MLVVLFCKQKTAYEMRISDWSSDVCSSDLLTSPACLKLLGAGHLGALGSRVMDQDFFLVHTRNDEKPAVTGTGNRRQGRLPEPFERGADRSEERRVGKECVRTV